MTSRNISSRTEAQTDRPRAAGFEKPGTEKSKTFSLPGLSFLTAFGRNLSAGNRIAVNLQLFMFCLFLVTLVTGGFALFSINLMMSELDRLETEDYALVEMVGQMERQAESIVSLAPAIAQAHTHGERQTARQRVDDRMGAIRMVLASLPENLLEDGLRDRFRNNISALHSTLFDLDDQVSLRLNLDNRLQRRYSSLTQQMSELESAKAGGDDSGGGPLPVPVRELLGQILVLDISAAIASHERQIDRLGETRKNLATTLLQRLREEQNIPADSRPELLSYAGSGGELFQYRKEWLQASRSIINLQKRSNMLSTRNVGLVTELRDRLASRLNRNREELRATYDSLWMGAIALGGGCLLILFLAQGFITLKLVNPLLSLQERVEGWGNCREPILPLKGEDEVVRLSRALSDLTSMVISREQELERHRDELETLNQQKNVFFSIIAHDLRSPFSAFIGIVDLLKNELREDYPNRDAVLEYATMIDDTTHRLLDLVENLLDWARVQMNRTEPRFAILELEPLVRDAVELAGPAARQKKVSIILEDCGEEYIRADQGMVQMALRNIIGNALKFSDPGSNIRISYSRRRDPQEDRNMTILEIRDEGLGIAEDKLGSLFDIAARTSTVGTAGTAGEAGSGLGLPLVKVLMDRIGGKIEIHSRIGQGTTVSLAFVSAIRSTTPFLTI